MVETRNKWNGKSPIISRIHLCIARKASQLPVVLAMTLSMTLQSTSVDLAYGDSNKYKHQKHHLPDGYDAQRLRYSHKPIDSIQAEIYSA